MNDEKCPMCEESQGHSYDCVTLWRTRRSNRNQTYTEKQRCGSCMFFTRPVGGVWRDKGLCGLPVTDHDDEVCPQGGRRVVALFGICEEYRHKDDERRSDRPWACYPDEWLDYNDDLAALEAAEK